MKLYLLTEINVVDYNQSQKPPRPFLDESDAIYAMTQRINELREEIKDKDDWEFEKSRGYYCQYEDGYACRNSDTLQIFEIEL